MLTKRYKHNEFPDSSGCLAFISVCFMFVVWFNFYTAAQCIVIGPVCGFVTAGGRAVSNLTTASARAVFLKKALRETQTLRLSERFFSFHFLLGTDNCTIASYSSKVRCKRH